MMVHLVTNLEVVSHKRPEIGSVLNSVTYLKNDYNGCLEILRGFSKTSILCLSVLTVHLHASSCLFNKVYKGHDLWHTTELSIRGI
jgi:hypothetical protein